MFNASVTLFVNNTVGFISNLLNFLRQSIPQPLHSNLLEIVEHQSWSINSYNLEHKPAEWFHPIIPIFISCIG